jgi:cathepsin E
MFVRAKILRARVEALAASTEHNSSAIVNEPVDNQAISYIAAIGVGTPPTTCQYCENYSK